MEIKSSNFIHKIGPKIREIRKKKQITLSEVSDKSGLSTPMISKTENGRVTPTLQTLFLILNAMEIDIVSFFEEINNDLDFEGYIHLKESDYQTYVKEAHAIGFEYKSIIEKKISDTSVQISLVRLHPGNSRPMITTEAYEFLYVLEGEIDYYLKSEHLKLEKGDSLFFDGNIPHVPLNKSRQNVSYIVIYFFTDVNQLKEDVSISPDSGTEQDT